MGGMCLAQLDRWIRAMFLSRLGQVNKMLVFHHQS